MTDQTSSALSTAAEQLYAALLTKQAANRGAVAAARRAKARARQGKPPVMGRTSWEGTRPKMQAKIKAAKPPSPTAINRPALPAPSAAPAPAARVITPAEVLPAPKKPLVPPRTGGGGGASGATINMPSEALARTEGAAARRMSRFMKGGLIGAGLGLAGYGAYKMLKGKDKAASAVGQLSTAPQEGAATPAILSKLIKEMAKDHPGMKHPMPTNPGPAYPSVEAEKKSKAVINIPMLGKSASVKAFRRLANEILPIG